MTQYISQYENINESKYRHNLPQLSPEMFLTDGGLETTLVFHHGYDLPEFAAIDLFRHAEGTAVLRDYYRPYADIARTSGTGFILESATWRASRDWGRKIGYTPRQLADMNKSAITLLRDLRDELETSQAPMVISGCIGPRGDGYRVTDKMTSREAARYHSEQINILAKTAADLVAAFTINYSEEAVGITWAAQAADIPVVIGFTVETDGRLPSGQSLKEAITSVDRATANGPAYFMINCAHPTHFREILASADPWTQRIRAVRANASAHSHAELDGAETLDDGDPQDFGAQYSALKALLPHLNIFGGCCGTDHRHVNSAASAVTLN